MLAKGRLYFVGFAAVRLNPTYPRSNSLGVSALRLKPDLPLVHIQGIGNAVRCFFGRSCLHVATLNFGIASFDLFDTAARRTAMDLDYSSLGAFYRLR